MALGWFDASEAKKFGVQLADLFTERVAPGTPEAAMGKKLVKQKTGALDYKISQQVQAFKQQHKLNIYKTAQIGVAFKEALLEAGHDAAYANELTHWLMHKIKAPA